MPERTKPLSLWGKWYRKKSQKNGGWRQRSIWTCIIEGPMNACHIMSWNHTIFCCPITPFLPEAPWVCCSPSANLWFCASFTVHFFPLIASFQTLGRRGEKGNKSKKSISGKCIQWSIKSEQEAFRKRGRLESEDHLLWIIGQIS